jgi:shikimate kinase
MQNIVLIGFMASGKSTLGKKLAKKLNFEFVDSDKEIEENTGKTIAAIFHDQGENYFRELENQFIKSLRDKSKIVLSTGGGLPCFHDNMNLLNDFGDTIYLKLSSNELSKRILNSKTERPLAKGKSPEELKFFVNKLLNQRENFYSQAKYILPGKNQNTKFISEMILEAKSLKL